MKLFYNAHLYKQDNDAFVCEGDSFKEFGRYSDLVNKYEYEEQIDLNGKYVYPGFNDSHMHLLNLGIFLCNISLYEHTSSIKEVQKHLREEIAKHPERTFFRGRGYNQDYFEEKRMLTRSDLDEVSTEVPILMTRACGHIGVCNSKAIEVLGIKADEKVEMGQFDLETGIFEEFALNMVYERVPKPDKKQLKEYLLKGIEHVNSYGVTSCHSEDFETCPGVDYKDIIAAYEELLEEGKLNVRINEQCQFPTIDGLKAFLADGYPHKLQNKHLRMGQLKLLADGSLGARTAFMTRDYKGQKDSKGLCLYSQEEMDEFVKLAYQNKMGTVVHCIGDGAIDIVLNSFKKVMKDDPDNKLHNGIVHVQITRKDQVEDIIKHNICCLVQSIFIDYDAKIVYEQVEKDIADTSYAFKTYLKGGVIVSNGSDSPVEEPDVLKGMECGITRTPVGYDTPYLIEEAFTVDEAIDTYTINGARLSNEESYKGLLKEGYLADFVVLDKDIAEVNKKDIHKIDVLETYLGSKLVYQR
ncbi:MAG: amidohydrolase family protein [Erysipelotrichaceae bacterium]|nr:amidohydrolase family protein [Erysipelotrichaceae bacterium]